MPEGIEGFGDTQYQSVMAQDDVSVPDRAAEVLAGVCVSGTDAEVGTDIAQVFTDVGFNILVEGGFPQEK